MRSRSFSARVIASLVVLALGTSSSPATVLARSWCAHPVVVHEWGVQSFRGSTSTRSLPAAALPRFFHDRVRASPLGTEQPPVRWLPADNGIRALPVLSFYAHGVSEERIPVGIEVGFARGDATAWYPQVDTHRTHTETTSAAARDGRAALARLRTQRSEGPWLSRPGQVASDPTRQLVWDHLSLTRRPEHALAQSPVAWLAQARANPEALWVNGALESERFVFYEGRTTEQPAVRIERGATYAAGRTHLLLRNVGSHVVHDVFLVHRAAGHTYVFYAPAIPSRATAGLLLEEHEIAADQVAQETRGRLRTQLMAPPANLAQNEASPVPGEDCVMMRDPAIPVDRARGAHLYAAEIDTLFDTWGARFFDAPGTTIVYREDTAYLEAMMPLSIYTDMFHDVRLERAGLAVVEGLSLP